MNSANLALMISTVTFIAANEHCVSLAAEQEASTAWTRFRGSNGAGVIEETSTIPVEFGPKKNVLWSRPFPAGHSSPCIWGSKMFFTAFKQEPDSLNVICVDRTDGNTLWEKQIPCGEIKPGHPRFSPASATAATDGNIVCVYFGYTGLSAFDLDGKPLWKFEMPPAPTHFCGHSVSPIIASGKVIQYRVTRNEHFLLAVNSQTGKLIWKHEFESRGSISDAGSATPVVSGNRVIVHTIDGVSSFNLETGKPNWWVNAPTNSTSSPVISGDGLLLATFVPNGEPDLRPKRPGFDKLLEKRDKNQDGKLAASEIKRIDLAVSDRPEVRNEPQAFGVVRFSRLDRDQDGFLSRKEWEGYVAFMKKRQATRIKDHGLLEIAINGNGDVSASHVTILERRAISEVPTPVVSGNKVFMIKNGGILTAIDRARKKQLYRVRVGAAGSYFASPLLVGTSLYLISVTGEVSVVDVSGDKPNVIARNELNDETFATPAIVDGVLYLRTKTHLYAFRKERN